MAVEMPECVMGKASLGLHGRRVSHPRCPRSVLPVTRDRNVNNAWIAGGERLIVKAERLECARTKILDDDVRLIGQTQSQIACVWGVEINAHVPLAAVLLRVVPGHAIDEWI